MSGHWGIVMVTALMPFAAVVGLLWVTRVFAEQREARVARQIMLTDAIHRELGAVAAPEVQRSWMRGWIVSMRLPLTRAHTVGAVTRITHDLFRRLDGQDPPRLLLVLIPQEIRHGQRARATGSPRVAARLGRAA
jgi:hypothetical protein